MGSNTHGPGWRLARLPAGLVGYCLIFGFFYTVSLRFAAAQVHPVPLTRAPRRVPVDGSSHPKPQPVNVLSVNAARGSAALCARAPSSIAQFRAPEPEQLREWSAHPGRSCPSRMNQHVRGVSECRRDAAGSARSETAKRARCRQQRKSTPVPHSSAQNCAQFALREIALAAQWSRMSSSSFCCNGGGDSK